MEVIKGRGARRSRQARHMLRHGSLPNRPHLSRRAPTRRPRVDARRARDRLRERRAHRCGVRARHLARPSAVVGGSGVPHRRHGRRHRMDMEGVVSREARDAASKQASKRVSKTGSEGVSEMASEHGGKSTSKRASDIYSSSSFPFHDSSETAPEHSPYARAEQMAAKACWWVRHHPEEWAALKRLVRYLEEEGDIVHHKIIGRTLIGEFARFCIAPPLRIALPIIGERTNEPCRKPSGRFAR